MIFLLNTYKSQNIHPAKIQINLLYKDKQVLQHLLLYFLFLFLYIFIIKYAIRCIGISFLIQSGRVSCQPPGYTTKGLKNNPTSSSIFLSSSFLVILGQL
jgi:hypothetical protein